MRFWFRYSRSFFVGSIWMYNRSNGWKQSNLTSYLRLVWNSRIPRWDVFWGFIGGVIKHFASGVSKWRVRQSLGQKRLLERESVADYSYSLRAHYAGLNLPRTGWGVSLFRTEISEYVVLQQPDSLEAYGNFAKLKVDVLFSSDKKSDIGVKG